MEIAYHVRPITTSHEAVLAVRERLLQRGRLPLKEWLAAKEIATKLVRQAVQQFEGIGTELSTEIANPIMIKVSGLLCLVGSRTTLKPFDSTRF